MHYSVLVVDALSAGTGKRVTSRDAIGCGPRVIAGVFEKLGISCRIRRAEELLQGRFRVRSFDHLAISAMSMDYPVVAQLIRKWRKAKQGKVILGGPITAGAETILRSLRPTVMVCGEGERTLEELVHHGLLEGETDLSMIKGIGFLKGDMAVMTPPRSLLTGKELSERYQPSTARIVDYPAYQASKVYVEVLRGCSNFFRPRIPLPDGRRCSDCGNCDAEQLSLRLLCPEEIPPGCGFCSVPNTWGAPRSRSADAIVTEVRELLELGVHRIVLEAPDFLDFERGEYPQTDPCTPPANLIAIRKLLSLLTALPQFENDIAHLAIENVKACLFTDEVAALLSEFIHSTSPNIGLESGSLTHLQQIGKYGSPSDVLRAVRIAQRHGLRPFVYFIYGLPGETDNSVTESVKFMERVSNAGAERIILYPFQPLPGSAFEDFPSARRDDPRGQWMRRAAERINRRKKDDFVGKVVRGIAAEPSLTHSGHTMVYPFGEGPIMTVAGGFSPGTVLNVRIIRVLSAGLVLGEVVH